MLLPAKHWLFMRFNKQKFEHIKFIGPDSIFEGSLGSYSKPVFKRVSSSSENTLWEHLAWRYHYLRHKGAMGRFVEGAV